MENPIEMDDLGVPLFLETPICIVISDLVKFRMAVIFFVHVKN